ncbi:MAG: L,D-transpeptidase family protein, partial [Verrucomicrobiota bacterium]
MGEISKEQPPPPPEEATPPVVIPSNTAQLIVGRTRSWGSSHVTLQLWERTLPSVRDQNLQSSALLETEEALEPISANGIESAVSTHPEEIPPGEEEEIGDWIRHGPRWYGKVGMYGLGWGRGLHPEMEGRQKREGDRRAPAGVFELGELFGYADAERIEKHEEWPYHKVTERSLWISDPRSEFYNQHIEIDPDKSLTSWERSHRMRRYSHSHSLKLFIKHNAEEDVLAGAGSAIFFHIWLHSRARSYGCTVMSESNLKRIVSWIDPAKNPLYVVLPDSTYDEHT